MKHFRYLANLEIALALAGWAVGLWGVVQGEKFILQYLYFFAWYPSIAFLDGLLFRLRGRSWLLTQPRTFLRMFFWSVTVWLSFEAFNLVLKNWGYVGMEPALWVRWGGYALAFATVLPGVLLTAQVLDALGAWRHLKARPFNPGAWQPASLLVGVALLILPLTFPRYAFPLIWAAMFFLLDPFCWLLGGPSLIAPLHPGRTPGACLSPGRGPDVRPLVGSLELLRHRQVGLYPAGARLLEGLRDAGPGVPGLPPLCPGVRRHV